MSETRLREIRDQIWNEYGIGITLEIVQRVIELEAQQPSAEPTEEEKFLTICRMLTGSLWPQNETTSYLAEIIEAHDTQGGAV